MYEIKYRKEDEMKDSGVEWLGMVPSDWSVNKIKYNIDFIQTGSTPITSKPDYYEGNINWFNPIDLNQKILVESKKNISNQAIIDNEAKLFRGNSVLIVGIGATAGKTSYLLNASSFNQQITGLHSKENNNKYLFYQFKNISDELLKLATFTTLPILNNEFLKNIELVFTTSNEQQKIANFLDLKTAEFDSIISKKELLIEKLEEAKKSLISEVVTGKVKIIDDELIERKSDEMKDSGVEWLGMIPKDWEVKRLKYLAKINPIKSEVKNNNIKCSFVPMDKIGKGEILLDEEKLVSEVYAGYTYFRNKDIVMAKVTPCFENGNIAIADNLTNGIAFGTTEINVFRAINIDLDFLYYTFQESHFMNYAVKHMTGVAGLKRIPTTYFENYYISLPNQTEQKLISGYIIKLVRHIYKIERKTKLQIQKLKEAKQSLISEAVTGKIDLRDWEIQEI